MYDSSSPGLLDLLYLAQKELPRAALCRALLRRWEVNDQKGMSSAVCLAELPVHFRNLGSSLCTVATAASANPRCFVLHRLQASSSA
jgi:hypothetical protein